MTDLVIVSMNEKGFPQAELYLGHGETHPREFRRIAPSSDGFFTMEPGDTLEAAFARAQVEYPNAKVVYSAENDDEAGD